MTNSDRELLMDAARAAGMDRCPFCGKSDTLKVTHASELHTEGPHSDSWAVMCDATRPGGPGGCGGSGGFFPTQAEAIAAWNRRTRPVSDATLLRQAAEALDRLRAFVVLYRDINAPRAVEHIAMVHEARELAASLRAALENKP